MANFWGGAKEELPGGGDFAKLNICAFYREAIMNEACVLKGVVDV